MMRSAPLLPVMLLLLGCAADDAQAPNEATMAHANMAHVHMGRVLTGWQDTPDQAGLLPTAIAEADVAVQHAGFAASRPDDLDWMKLHVGHVLHAVDPATEPAGPGLGYGVERAAQGVAQHVGFELAGAVDPAPDAATAAPLVEEIETLALAIRNGVDADGDGQVTWQAGEGGLAQAEQHMGFMRAGEGLS